MVAPVIPPAHTEEDAATMLNHPAALGALATERRVAAARAERLGPLTALASPPAWDPPRRRTPAGRIVAEWWRFFSARIAPDAAR